VLHSYSSFKEKKKQLGIDPRAIGNYLGKRHSWCAFPIQPGEAIKGRIDYRQINGD
jgi:hypothetical protein